jgi:hypothetical protein
METTEVTDANEATVAELLKSLAETADACEDAKGYTDRRRAEVVDGKQICPWDALDDAEHYLRQAAKKIEELSAEIAKVAEQDNRTHDSEGNYIGDRCPRCLRG